MLGQIVAHSLLLPAPCFRLRASPYRDVSSVTIYGGEVIMEAEKSRIVQLLTGISERLDKLLTQHAASPEVCGELAAIRLELMNVENAIERVWTR